jgi:large subunit ribosomal protein L18
MNNLEKNKKRRQRIKFKIRNKLRGTSERPRLVVYRSLKHMYAQLVDDVNSKTIIAVSTKSKEVEEKIKDTKDKKEISKLIGLMTAEKAKEKNISKIVFDRNGYLYHGRVRSLADGAREGGLIF